MTDEERRAYVQQLFTPPPDDERDPGRIHT
jgi:hypothetical protein